MQALLTSYLILNSDCDLPYIGSLKIIKTGTVRRADQIFPPSEEIIFSHDHTGSESLAKYIAGKKNISHVHASQILDDFCSEWKQKIDSGEALNLETVGSIRAGNEGKFYFEREKTSGFLEPVTIEKALHRDRFQAVTAVSNEIAEPAHFHDEEPIEERSFWGIWAIILVAIGSVILFYHFYNNRLSTSSIGDQSHFNTDTAAATFSVP